MRECVRKKGAGERKEVLVSEKGKNSIEEEGKKIRETLLLFDITAHFSAKVTRMFIGAIAQVGCPTRDDREQRSSVNPVVKLGKKYQGCSMYFFKSMNNLCLSGTSEC